MKAKDRAKRGKGIAAQVANRAVKHSNTLSRRRWLAWVGLGLAACLLVGGVLIMAFGNAFLNGYGKGKVERAFAAAYPGYALRLGDLQYSVGANRLVAQSVILSADNVTLRTGRASLKGVRWAQLLRGKAALAVVLSQASLDATNLDLQLPQAHYGIRCGWLRASVPGSELILEGIELKPLIEDEAFFAAHAFRTARFLLVAPECRVLGLAYGEILQGKSYRAQAIHLTGPAFEALINGDKPVQPFMKSPLMVHEALAAMRSPLQVGTLTITNAHVRYCKRLAKGADPGVLTFTAVSISVAGLANRGEAAAAIQLRGEGEFMGAGILKVQMSIPITPPSFAFHYSGSLGASDLTCLNAFVETVEHTRINSGSAQEVAFEIKVTAGQAHGHVRAIYKDLKIAVLDKQTGSSEGLDDRFASFLANLLKVRSSNTPDAKGLTKEGNVNLTREPQDEFAEFAWLALWSGVLDLISH